jgi:hypothetical protein
VYIQYLGEIVPPRSQNTLGVYNQITLLVFYYISSRLYPFLKSFMPRYKSLTFFNLLLV